jgi:hypothetical protein
VQTWDPERRESKPDWRAHSTVARQLWIRFQLVLFFLFVSSCELTCGSARGLAGASPLIVLISIKGNQTLRNASEHHAMDNARISDDGIALQRGASRASRQGRGIVALFVDRSELHTIAAEPRRRWARPGRGGSSARQRMISLIV